MAFYKSKYTGTEIDQRLTQGIYDDAVAAGFTGTKEQFDAWIAAYTPQEMEKLNNKQDKEDPMLETENKTVVGAINLLNSEKQDKEDERLATESKIVVDAINELNTRTTDLYYDKQDKEDSGLVTEQKTIVGAINELRFKFQDQDSQKQDKIDNGFATNDKSVVGAVNEIHNELDTCVADYNEHIDEYEVFKANTENTLNSHSTQIGQLTQEKQDKTDFNLATKSKTVVDAINENHAAITAEVARSVAEDTRLEEVKVSYTDISDDTNPDRKTIMLKNHDSLSGYGTDGTTTYNLAMVSKWNKADFGAAGIRIINRSDYAIGFDLSKNGYPLFSHTSSSSGDYLGSGQSIEYFDTSPATYSINLSMHCGDGHTIDRLCPTCQKKLTINGNIPDNDDFYTVATRLGMMRVIILDVEEGGLSPDPILRTNNIEVQITELGFDPVSWSIVSQDPVASTITVEYVVNGSTHTLGTISQGSNTGSSGLMIKSRYNSITSWKCIPSSDATYRYTVNPNEYQ